MSQYGKNAGARHVQVYGVSTSVVNRNRFSNEELFDKDIRTLGVLSYAHNKFLTCFPKEIVNFHCKQMEDQDVGDVAAEDIPEGK